MYMIRYCTEMTALSIREEGRSFTSDLSAADIAGISEVKFARDQAGVQKILGQILEEVKDEIEMAPVFESEELGEWELQSTVVRENAPPQSTYVLSTMLNEFAAMATIEEIVPVE